MEHTRKYGQIKLIANALGSPPDDVIAVAHENGVKVAALAGTSAHALHHIDAGVDIVIAQGYEGGGHTGDVASMVLWPEIVDAVGDAPVLAAGGVGDGRQIAAAIALGAQGVWMGTYWLTAAEYNLGVTGDGPSTVQQALLKASSRDTVRRRIYSGKPARLLKTRWTDAWDAPGAPEPLPMPLQNLLVGEAHARISAADDPEVVAMPAGRSWAAATPSPRSPNSSTGWCPATTPRWTGCRARWPPAKAADSPGSQNGVPASPISSRVSVVAISDTRDAVQVAARCSGHDDGSLLDRVHLSCYLASSYPAVCTIHILLSVI